MDDLDFNCVPDLDADFDPIPPSPIAWFGVILIVLGALSFTLLPILM